MNYFKPTFTNFFRDLSKNNSSLWFNENRKTYENEVKKPFALFVDELIGRIQKHEPTIKIKASEAITRINKDIRFSKDKIPYNTYVGAIISPTGRKSKEYPGMYIQLGADKILIYGGAYMLEKENLQKIRTQIAKNPAELDKVLAAASFKKKYGAIQGEKNKILPPEFKALVAKQPLIANKSFFFMAELDAKLVTSDKLMETIIEYYVAGKPMNDFLIKAFEK
jgi:uncharacterized protein (TIGR02453 family)